MKKLFTGLAMTGFLVVGLFTGVNEAKAERIEPLDNTEYNKYIEEYLDSSNKYYDKVVFYKVTYDKKSTEENRKLAEDKGNEYMFYDFTYEGSGKKRIEPVPVNVWKENYKGSPKQDTEYISVIYTDIDLNIIFKRIDIIEVTDEVETEDTNSEKEECKCNNKDEDVEGVTDESKPTCKLKKTVNGDYKRVCSK